MKSTGAPCGVSVLYVNRFRFARTFSEILPLRGGPRLLKALRRKGWGAFPAIRWFSPAQIKQIPVGDEICRAVKHCGSFDAVLRHIFRHGSVVVPQVDEVHLREPLGQKRRQGVGIGIPNQQNLASVPDIRVFNDTQGLVSAQKRAVLILVL